MTIFRLILKNLRYYWQKNLLLALGVSVSAAIITGALIVGDSVKYSLSRIVDDRLGSITHVVKAGDRFLTVSLADSLGSRLGSTVSPALLLNGIASSGGGDRKVEHVNIIGVENDFDLLAGQPGIYDHLSGNDLVISANLASRLSVNVGDEVLLRITRASLIPMNAPFVSDAENIVSERFTVKKIAGKEELGTFNIQNSQTAPFNAFVSIQTLNRIMDLRGKSNLFLVAADNALEPGHILELLALEWSIEDAGLHIQSLSALNELEINSERVFIDEITSSALLKLNGLEYPVLTYFVNDLSVAGAHTPYSFVSTLPDSIIPSDGIIINEWLAGDLGAGTGDSLEMKYFVIGPLRELSEKESDFIIHSVVKMEGRFADPDLMPRLPGLSDAGNCRDWETGIPIDLSRIRDKDEKYWDEWKGTPKAFIAQSKALELWKNRFGNYTAFRYSANMTTREELSETILKTIHPAELGITSESLRKQADYAAANGINFSQLFGGLSFFLLAAGILLSLLLFLLNLEFRKDQLQILASVGIPSRKIFTMIFSEGLFVGFLGSIAGLFLALLYNQAVFSALNGVWRDIIRTDMMVVKIFPFTLVEGLLISVIVTAASLYFPLRKFLKKQIHTTERKRIKNHSVSQNSIIRLLSIISGSAGIVLIIIQLARNELVNTVIFFLAGGLFLVCGITASRSFLSRIGKQSFPRFEPFQLSLKNSYRNPSRSMTIVILFALATFLVISTGSNRKDLFVNADDPSSGTGGFLYYAESTIPVLQNLNNPGTRFDYGLGKGYSFVQFRKTEGDDASCLNLNKISNPEIIATDPARLDGRFSFVTKTPILDEKNPWLTLSQKLPGGVIPAIADETVIKWGLGMKVGDTLQYIDAEGNPMKLMLVGGLAPSIFQGKVIISSENFLARFPQNSGTSVFLVEGSIKDTLTIVDEINNGMRDFGMDITLAAERLAEFNSVTNTYLSIFLVMGALGLLLGTIGLGIVLFKSVLERKNEVALMRAVGVGKKTVRRIIGREYLLLLFTGTLIGFLTAMIATLPSIISPNTDISLRTLLILISVLLVNGWIWTRLMTELSLKSKNIYEALRND